MKKLFLLAVLIVLLPIVVKAETFYAGEQVKEVPLYLDKITKQSYRYFKTAYRTSDNVLVYCVEPDKLLSVTNEYNFVEEKQWEKLNINYETWRRLELLAYFGYGYDGHDSERWAAITQYMLWQTVLPEGWYLTFTNGYGGEFKNIHEKETNEIENLIKDFEILPSFSNQKFNLTKKEQLILKDANNNLEKYELINNTPLEIIRNSNELIINATENGTYTLEFVRGNYKPTKLYMSDNDQSVISTDGVPENRFVLTVEVESGNLALKRGYDDYLNNDSKRENAVYEIIDSKSNKHILSTNQDGIINLSDLPIGEVTIKELNPSVGYEKDANIYKVTIKNNENTILEVNPRLIVKKVNIIKKYLIEDENLLPNEVNSIFSVLKQDEYKLTDITNENGTVSFLIPYGKYIIKQDSTLLGYELMKDCYINVENSIEENLSFINYKKVIEETPEENPEESKPLEPEIPVSKDEQSEDTEKSPVTEEVLNNENNNKFYEDINDSIVFIENPKTNDNIYKNLLIFIISSLFLVKILHKMQ